MSLVIVDYDAGNLTSVQRACTHLGIDSRISADPGEIADAARIIFPGVGHAARAVAVLKERGIDRALQNAYEKATPILGICLGTQIILSHSEEGDTPCLDLIAGKCVRFTRNTPSMKIPQIGWNGIFDLQPHPLLEGVAADDEFYFVHSYYPVPDRDAQVMARCEYGGTVFAAAIGRGSIFATQFHPEKSGKPGLRIVENFCHWDGTPCSENA